MLSEKEVKIFSKLAKKIKNVRSGLPQEVFDALSNIVTHVACEVVIVNEQGEVLLTWREDKFWKGWHFPGGLLRYRESFLRRLKIVAQLELGIKLRSANFLFPMNYTNGGRGHDVSVVFLCKVKGKRKDGKFFKTMPKNIIPEHKLLWRKVKTVLKKA